MSGCCDPYDDRPEQSWRTGAVSTVVCGTAAIGGWAVASGDVAGLSLGLLLVAYAAGGWEATTRAFGAVRRGKLDVDLLMLMAASGAAVVGHWVEGAALLFLFSLGTTLEEFAFGRTRRSIRALMELRPDDAGRVEDGRVNRVPLGALTPGDVVRVRPGERVPVDGEVVDGSSYVDESTLTGEPTPVSKKPSSPVFAGTLNGSGSLDVTMTRAADDTTLARVIRLVEDAREARAPTQSWIEAVESRYAAGVILGAVVAVLLPWGVLGWTLDDAFYRAMTLLVVASPCALVISIPATIVSAVSSGARHGVLFKGGAHLDALSEIRVIALDKTGTMTVGRPELAEIVTEASLVPASVGASGEADAPTLRWSDDDVLRLVASAESRSEHPLGEALVRAAALRGLDVPQPESFISTPGHGVEATVEGVRVRVGRRSWIGEATNGTANGHELLDAVDGRRAGASPVYVGLDGRVAAAITISDTPRSNLSDSIARMRRQGVRHIAMLTGDDRGTAQALAAELDIDSVHAELLPDGKSRVLDRLREEHGPVAMVGDGVNDAPALAVADVGIALGAAGTDVALETADVVIMGENLNEIGHALRLSHRARRVVRQNLVFSVGVMAGLVLLALAGQIGLTAGVIGHEGSTVIVVFNGLRLLVDRDTA